MSVGITVTSSCGLSVSNINFETMDPTARESAPTSATAGPLTYACSPGSVSPSISYGQGLHYSGGNQMAGATTGATIPYSLTMPTIAAFAGPRRTARISATIPARTALPSADVFSDTVILTVSY